MPRAQSFRRTPESGRSTPRSHPSSAPTPPPTLPESGLCTSQENLPANTPVFVPHPISPSLAPDSLLGPAYPLAIPSPRSAPGRPVPRRLDVRSVSSSANLLVPIAPGSLHPADRVCCRLRRSTAIAVDWPPVSRVRIRGLPSPSIENASLLPSPLPMLVGWITSVVPPVRYWRFGTPPTARHRVQSQPHGSIGLRCRSPPCCPWGSCADLCASWSVS